MPLESLYCFLKFEQDVLICRGGASDINLQGNMHSMHSSNQSLAAYSVQSIRMQCTLSDWMIVLSRLLVLDILVLSTKLRSR